MPYHELLAYAKRISKFTVPPTLRPPPESEPLPVENPGGGEQGKDGETNGVNGDVVKGAAGTAENGKAHGIGVSSLEAGESQWLDPSAQIPFVPWPTEEVIRRGALARIQVMLEQGVDPANAPDAGVQEETKQEVDTEVKRESAVVEPSRRESISARAGRVDVKREEKPAVFGGLDLYDPDND